MPNFKHHLSNSKHHEKVKFLCTLHGYDWYVHDFNPGKPYGKLFARNGDDPHHYQSLPLRAVWELQTVDPTFLVLQYTQMGDILEILEKFPDLNNPPEDWRDDQMFRGIKTATWR